MANDLFRGNVKLRRAINYAVDRRAYGAQAGSYAGIRWTRLLSPACSAGGHEQPYPPSAGPR